MRLTVVLVGAWFAGLLLIRALMGHGFAWDENWYESILVNGYSYKEGVQSNIAFFPLYPLALFVVSLGVLPHQFIAVVVGFLLVTAVCLLAIKISHILNSKSKEKYQNIYIVAAILCFPTSFFFAAMYVEALLALLITLAIYLALKEKYLLAFLVAGFASGAKFTGIIAVIACVAILFTQNKFSKKLTFKTIGYLAVGVSGLLIYVLFLQIKFHDPLIFFKVQETWGRTDVLFVKGLYREVVFAAQGLTNTAISRSFEFMRILNIAVVVGVVVLGWIAIKQKTIWLATFLLATISIPLLSGSFDSISRYVLVALPVTAAYFVPQIKLQKRNNRIIFIAVTATGLMLSIGLYAYFIKAEVFIA